MKYGLYLHIPFCREKCDYCNFYSVPVNRLYDSYDIVSDFIERVLREIRNRLKNFKGDSLDTIYFGGGSPSLLRIEEIDSLIKAIANEMEFEKNIEITIEMNPEDSHSEKLNGYSEAGINRIVLGVQTLNQKVHSCIGRSSSLCNTAVLDEFFEISDINHCIDIISGTPDQNEADLMGDLDQIVEYKPTHISAYILSIEKETPLYQRMEYSPKIEETQRMIFEKTISRLKEKGYDHYEISNYALPGKKSQHNMKYWKFLPYIGIGPGAHSFIDDVRYINTRDVEEYLKSRSENLIEDRRKKSSLIVEYFLTGLRLLEGISTYDLEKRLDAKIPDTVHTSIKKLYRSGLLSIEDEEVGVRLALTREGLFFADSVIYQIVESIL